MHLTSAKEITEPKIKVCPPLWVMLIFWIVMVIIFLVLMYLPIGGTTIKISVIAAFSLVMLGITRNYLKGSFLVTMQANSDGIYFQTLNQDQYFYVPWKNIGIMEKADYPLNSRGLRIEVTGEYKSYLSDSDCMSEIREVDGYTFVYTSPQLQDRDSLIDKFLTFKSSSN